MDPKIIKDYRLKLPFNFLCIGPTSSGKTSLILELLARRSTIFDTSIDNIVYLSACKQSRLDDFKKKCPIFNLVYSREEAENYLNDGTNRLYVIDDHMTEICDNRDFNAYVTKWVTVLGHHSNTSVIILLQNMFPKNLKSISNNCQYLLLMRQIRDKTSASILSRQFMPGKPHFIPQALERATKNGIGTFLFLDFHTSTPDFARVRNFIWIQHPDKNTLYLPK